MPQLSKGGKYIFGWVKIRPDGEVPVPEETVKEYSIQSDEKVILISGSKASGGFIVARIANLEHSSLSGILSGNPDLTRFETKPGKAIPYKGRLYCWVHQYQGILSLPTETLGIFGVQPGDNLLVIRGSNLAFVCAKKGPIVEKAQKFPGMPVFK